MTTITQRRKLSKGAWALIILLFVVIIAVSVAAVYGLIDLTFLSDLLVGYAMFGTTGWINAALIIIGPLVTGMILAVIVYRYFIGQKVTVSGMPGTSYIPGGQTVPESQKNSETVIS